MSDRDDAFRAAAEAALPPLEGEIRLPELRAPVEVLRDAWGVPHVYAENSHDLFLTQGYLIASERLFQSEMLVRLGLGRLSELLSDLTLGIDRFVRTVGWNRAARRHVREWDELSLEMGDAYAAGYRAWVEAMPAPPLEYVFLEAQPWVPQGDEAREAGAASALLLAWSLSRAWDNDLLRAEIAERLGVEAMRTLFPDVEPNAEAVRAGKEPRDPRLELLARAVLPPSGQGSNNWVVAGSRTETGKPLLANDPHLIVQLPSAWYEIHLTAPGIDVAGVTFPFAPGVVIGHNEHIAWGFTNTEADVQDLFLERLSERGAEYLGGQEPVTVHREEITVRGQDDPEVLEVTETRHGPVLSSYLIGIGVPEVVEGGVRRTYALRWVADERTVEPSTVFRLNSASNWDEFRAALKDWHCPGQNVVYADVDGNIGYQCTGLYPIRRRGDGSLPVPGWTDEYEWEGWVPYDELPRSLNPASGFLCTANNRVYDEGYPHHLGSDFIPPFRARRIAHLIAARETHSRESFARMQMDTVSLPAEAITAHLLQVEPRVERQKHALEILAEWDYDLGPDSTAAAIYEVWTVHIARRVLLPLLGEELFKHFYARRQWTNGFQFQVLPAILAYPTARWFGRDGVAARDDVLRDALDGALDELGSRLGDDMGAWRWGAIHTVRFAGRLALVPGLTELFTAGEVELGGDEQTVHQALFEPGVPYEAAIIPSWRMVVDLADPDASVGVHTPGQSGNPASPHFRDQLELWRRGELHPLPFSRAAVTDAAVAALRLTPKG